MADLQEIVNSRDFRNSSREQQRAVLASRDPGGFGALSRSDQDGLLGRVENEVSRDWWEGEFGAAYKRGLASGAADFAHIAANTADLIAEDSEAAEYMRSLSEDLAEDSESPDDRTYAELAAEIAGQITVSLPVYAAATYAAGAGLAAGGAAALARFGVGKAGQAAIAQYLARYGAPMGVFGMFGALGHADQGFQAAMTAGSKEAAFGALFGVMQNTGRAARASVLGTVAYAMTPEDMDPEERVGHGLTMAILGGLHSKPQQGGAQAILKNKVDDAVAAKMEGEAAIVAATGRYGSNLTMQEALQERLLITQKDAKAIEASAKELPPEQHEAFFREQRQMTIESLENQIEALTNSLHAVADSPAKIKNIKKQIKRREDKLKKLKEDEEIPEDLAARAAEPDAGGIDEVSSPRTETEGTGDPSSGGARGRATERELEDTLDPAEIRISEASDWRREEYLDAFHGFRWAAEQMDQLDVPGNIYMSARGLRGMAEMQDRMITQGMIKWVEDPKRPGEMMLDFQGRGFGERLFPILTDGKAYEQEFFQYSHARASRELINQTIDMKTGEIRQSTPKERAELQTREKNWSEEKIREGEALENETYSKVHEDMVAANNEVMDLAVELDFVTAEQRGQFRRDEYSFAFLREREVGQSGRHRTMDKLSTAMGVPKLHGSKKNTRDEMHNYVVGPQNLVRATLHNKFTRDTVKQLDAAGGFGKFIKPAARRIVVGKEQIQQAIRTELKETKGWTDAEVSAAMKWQGEMPGRLERLAFFIGAGRPYGENIVTFLEAGKPKYFQIYDPVLFRAFESMDPTGRTDLAGRWMANFKDFKQTMITLDPSFIFGNFIRDPLMSSIMSRTGHQHLTASLRGLKHVWTNSKEFNELMANGLGGSSIRNNIAVTRKRLIQMAERDKYSPLNHRNLMLGPKDIYRWLNDFGRAIELGPRVGEALKARDHGVLGRKGKPAMMKEAVYAGREVSTDFAVRGGGRSLDEYPAGVTKDGRINFGFSWGPQLTRFMGDTVPFFNAMLAGADRGFRAVARDPHGKAATALKMGGVGIASTLLWAINRDLANRYGHLMDEDGRPMVDYFNLPDWATTAYWHFYIPTEFDPETKEPTRFRHWHLPKLWEVGMIGTWGERFAQSMYDGTMADKELLFDLIQITAHNFNINTAHKGLPMPLPAGIDVMMEQAMNQILFTGQPIETVGMKEIDPWARARSGQSRTITELGELSRHLPGGKGVSPARAEALLRGIFGNWASMGLQLTDEGIYPGGPALGWDDVPMVRRIFSEAGKYDRNTAEYYENLEMFNQAMGTFRDRAKLGDIEMARELINDPDQRALIAMAPGFDRANRRLQLLNREIALLRRGVAEPLATPKERHHMINQIEATRNRIMKKLNEMAEEFKKKARR